MKKYLFGALALPLLFACSSEDFEKQVVSNDQFAGIPKVDATFSFDEGPTTRMDGTTGWHLAEGDKYGFAWLGGGDSPLAIDGRAWQNHPLTQKSGIFTPETSIYVGKYYIYRPYDKTVVDIEAINFKSLEEQPLKDLGGQDGFDPLSATAIILGDKWTNVTKTGTDDASTGMTWNKAGIKEHYDIYAAFFSNQTGLDLKYVNNNEKFDGKRIQGATDIDYTYPTGSTIGAADITKIEVQHPGAAKSFKYAPAAAANEPVVKAGVPLQAHSGTFWADKSGASAAFKVDGSNGFTFSATAPITLNAPTTTGVTTDKADSKAWFWFNSLPNTLGTAVLTDNVVTKLYTSYGDVTVTEQLGDCAQVLDYYDATSAKREWIKLVDTGADDNTTTPKEWDITLHNTFVNQYGNHKGKYELTVDFKNSDMSVMHIQNDAHLQKALKFYIASGKSETLTLNLDKDVNGEFKISKISIALIQTIQNAGHDVKVQPCTLDGTHTPTKIVVTQEDQASIPELADKTEVPALNNVFKAAVNVYLASGTNWTWGDKIKNGTTVGKLTVDANVTSITNLGTLTVNVGNIELSTGAPLYNAAGATMKITKVTTVKNNLTNLGTIEVGASDNTVAELRAYNATITNNAEGTKANEKFGTINNYGVVGKSAGTSGIVNNYGLINMFGDAITLLRTNEISSASAPKGPFSKPFADGTNMMGTVVLPDGNPYALVSVANGDETGFIKYNWSATTYTHDAKNVKYNTIVVSNNITFTGGVWNPAIEIKFIEFNGTRTQVVNPAADSSLPNLKGIIVNAGKSIILEKTNVLNCLDGAYLGAGATIYRGGDFKCNGANFAAAQTNNYLGTWSLDQIVEW